jgi:hypothetical protein
LIDYIEMFLLDFPLHRSYLISPQQSAICRREDRESNSACTLSCIL